MTDSEKRRYVKYTEAECWQAVVDSDGDIPTATAALGMTSKGYLIVKMTAAAARKGLPFPAKGRTHADRVACARALLGQTAIFEAPAEPLRPMKVVSPPRPDLPAVCHPDREEFMARLCRSCYDERVRRSRAATEAHEVDRVPRPLLPAPLAPVKRRTRTGPVIRMPGERAPRGEGGAQNPAVVMDQLEGLPGRQRYGGALSPQEMRVLTMLAEGYTNKEAAYELGISEQTVKNHNSAVFRKLGVSNRDSAFKKLGWLKAGGIGMAAAIEETRRALEVIGAAFESAKGELARLEQMAQLAPGEDQSA